MSFQTSISQINDFEKQRGYPKDSLLRPMLFETAGTLDPAIQNTMSKAVGLIQFLPSTLANMGLSVNVVKSMTVPQQLSVVRDYLQPYHSKLLATNDGLDFYLSILYPALIGKPDSAIMAKKGSITYTQNSGLDFDKDGIITKGDIRKYFYKATDAIAKKKGITFFNPIVSIVFLVVGIAIIFLISKS